MRVHWTDRAKARLREIESYITEEGHNPTAAKKLVERILRRSWQIGELPLSGREIATHTSHAFL